MKKMIMAGGGVLLLLGINVGATAFFARSAATDAALAAVDAFVKATQEPDAAAAEPVEVFYHHIQPEFVVNLPGSGRSRFLMVEMSVAMDDEQVAEVLEDNRPELRNELLMLLGEQDMAALIGNTGKTALRESARERIETLVAKHYGPEHVLDVYLTRFVIQ